MASLHEILVLQKKWPMNCKKVTKNGLKEQLNTYLVRHNT